jgi:molecular chaperone GrpE
MSDKPQQDEQQPQDPPQAQEPAVDQPEGQLAQLRRERDEFESKYLRAAADLQNYMRRAQQNMTHAQHEQLRSVAGSLLAVLDHFDNALQIDPDKTNAGDVLKGVQIVRDELLTALERYGIKRLDVAEGEEFDPNRHEAVMRQTKDGVASNHVVMQVQPGYMLDDKTLRPAKVTIAE